MKKISLSTVVSIFIFALGIAAFGEQGQESVQKEVLPQKSATQGKKRTRTKVCPSCHKPEKQCECEGEGHGEKSVEEKAK